MSFVNKNSTKQQEISRRRLIISKLRHEGVKTQSDIARRLLDEYGIDVTQQTISIDLKALDLLWKQSALANTDKWKQEALKQYRYLYQQSLAAWELSLEDAEETTTGGQNGPSEKVKGQSGNPAHLRNAQESLKAIRDLLGLDIQPGSSEAKPFFLAQIKEIVVNRESVDNPE
jgi:arginine repressor-like DNA binding protein